MIQTNLPYQIPSLGKTQINWWRKSSIVLKGKVLQYSIISGWMWFALALALLKDIYRFPPAPIQKTRTIRMTPTKTVSWGNTTFGDSANPRFASGSQKCWALNWFSPDLNVMFYSCWALFCPSTILLMLQKSPSQPLSRDGAKKTSQIMVDNIDYQAQLVSLVGFLVAINHTNPPRGTASLLSGLARRSWLIKGTKKPGEGTGWSLHFLGPGFSC